MSLKVGVTGGIGSGKTTVCKMLSVLGIPVFSADNEARKIMDSDPAVIEKVNAIAGTNLYGSGLLDRQELARLIFNNSNLLGRINRLIHPMVLRSFTEWASQQKSPYVVMESAILIESGASACLDKVLVVTAPLEERIARVMNRNGFTREQVLERIRNQGDDDQIAEMADFIISNAENDMVIPEILKINEQLLASANITG